MGAFLASKKVTVVLLLALIALLAGGSWYIFQQGQKIGELESAQAELDARKEDDAKRATGLAQQAEALKALREQGARQERRILAALEAAGEDFRRCFDMPVPDGMRIDDGYGDSR